MVPLPVIFGLLIIVLLWAFNKLARPKNFPPGPFVFPIAGILPHFITRTFFEKVEEWRETYGNIFSLSFGSHRAILIHDLDLIKEAFNMEEFTGRPLMPSTREIATDKRRGITFAEGAQWEAQRRFALRNLRNFGFGKKSAEAATLEDIGDLIAKFKSQLGQPVSTAKRFNNSVVNSLWHIMTGQRYDIDDPAFRTILDKINASISTGAGNAPVLSIEWAIKLAPDLTGWNKFKKAVDGAKEFMKEQIEQHKASFQAGDLRDFMDAYIKEIEETKDKTSSFYKTAGDENLLTVTGNLLAAGTETTSSTLTWALLYLSRNPSIQKKLQAEIDRVVGRSRLPSLADQDAMPFVSATILEILRKSTLVPLSIPHCTMSDTQFHGFTIPKNTIVLANLYELHHSKKIWGDPEVFRPERFLASDGKLKKDHPPVVAFSIGRRQCLGETLARNNVFLFLVCLFQTFDINEPTGSQKQLEEPRGIIRFPPEFKVVFEERN